MRAITSLLTHENSHSCANVNDSSTAEASLSILVNSSTDVFYVHNLSTKALENIKGRSL